MPQPWDWGTDWVESGTTYYNLTSDMPEWQDYVQTVGAYYYNSMGAPMYVSFAILGTFGVLVLLATMKQSLFSIPSVRRTVNKNALAKPIRKHIVNAPLFRLRHAQSVPLLGRFVSLQLPLRLDSIILFSLFMVNLLPIVTFYRPYTKNNIYWPIHYDEILRYVSDRSGVMATMELPPLFILAGRNNLVSWATGCSYEKCMLYHRWFARFVFAQVIVHAIGFSLVYASDGGGLAAFNSMFVDPYVRWGTAGTVAFGLCVFLSLRYLRQRSYEVFVLIHVVMAIVALVGTYYHIHLLDYEPYADFINAIYFCVAVYCLDKAARVLRVVMYSVGVEQRSIVISKDTVDVISQDERSVILRHEVTLQGYGKRASSLAGQGKYIQLWLPRLQPLSSHPFTVAQVCRKQGSDEMCAYLYSKVHKGVTNSLLRRIGSSAQKQTTHFALVEGFYGHVPSTEGYGQVLLLSGGIGITACWPAFLQAKEAGKSAEMHWVIPDPAMLHIILDMVRRMTPAAKASHDADSKKEVESQDGQPSARIVVHVTLNDVGQETSARASSEVNAASHVLTNEGSSSPSTENEKDAGNKTGEEDVKHAVQALARQHDISIDFSGSTGRPNVVEIVEQHGASDNVVIISCGPDGFCDDARKASNMRGIAYHEEAFQW